MSYNNLLFNRVFEASNVNRYSGNFLVSPEPLSSHVYEVMMMSYMLANELNTKFDAGIDIKSLLEKGLLHDVDETMTADIPRNTKYATKHLKQNLDIVADKAVDTISRSHPGLSNIEEVWNSAKEGTDGLIIKLCDMLVVARKAMIEVELYHNYSALKIVSELSHHLKVLVDHQTGNTEMLEYLKSICVEISDDINNLRNSHIEEIKKFRLNDGIIQVED